MKFKKFNLWRTNILKRKIGYLVLIQNLSNQGIYERNFNNKYSSNSNMIYTKKKCKLNNANLKLNNEEEKNYNFPLEYRNKNNINNINSNQRNDGNNYPYFSFQDRSRKCATPSKLRNTKREYLIDNSQYINKDDSDIIVRKKRISKEEQDARFNSLYNDSKKRNEKIRKMVLEKEMKFNTVYTFSPEVYENKKFNGNLRFDERLNNYQRTKRENLQKIKKEIEENTPKPKVIKRSNIKDQHLIPYSKNYFQNRKAKLEKIEEEMIKEQKITFKPSLNEEINSNIKSNLIERNDLFIKHKKEKLNSKVDEVECTFIPKINQSSNKTINQQSSSTSGRQNIGQNQNVGERLYEYQSKYIKNLLDKKNLYLENYSFKPKISENTDEILKNKKRMIEEMNNVYAENNEENNEGMTESNLAKSKSDQISEQEINNPVKEVKEEDSSSQKKSKNKLEIIKESTNKKDIELLEDDNFDDKKILEMAKLYLNNDDSNNNNSKINRSKPDNNQINFNNYDDYTLDSKKESKDEISSISEIKKGNNNYSKKGSKKGKGGILLKNFEYYDNL